MRPFARSPIAIHCDAHSRAIPSSFHSTTCPFADRSASEVPSIVHSTLDSVRMCLWKYFAAHYRHFDVSAFHYRLGESVSSCEVARQETLALDHCCHFHFDVSSLVLSRCKETRSRVTCSFGAMEGHFECKLIAELGSNCEEVICPSMVICRMYRENLHRDLKAGMDL